VYSLDAVARRYPVHINAPQPMQRKSSSLESRAILDKYKIRGPLRQELLHGVPTAGVRRYRMHCNLAHQLHKKGVPKDEAFVCLRDTGWNKHATENPDNPDFWVWALIDKIWGE
jgi:hypothetical protein